MQPTTARTDISGRTLKWGRETRSPCSHQNDYGLNLGSGATVSILLFDEYGTYVRDKKFTFSLWPSR